MFRIYLANKIGAEALGIYQVGFSLFIVLATIVGSGLPLTVSKLTAKYRAQDKLNKEHSTVSASLIIGLLVSSLIVLLIFLFRNIIGSLLTSKSSINILLALSPAIIATALFSSFRGSLWGQKNHLAVSLTEFIEQIFRILICFILIEFSILNLTGEINASIALTLGCFISAIIAAIFYFRTGGKLKSPKGHYKKLIKTATPITGVRVASSLIQPLIAVLLPMRLVASGFTTSQAMSQLGVFVGMTFPLLFLPITIVGSLSTALIPELSGLIATKNNKELTRQVNTSLLFSLSVAMLVMPIYLGLGKDIGQFLFNNAQSGVYLASSAWVMAPVSLASISASVLNALGLEIKSFKNYLLGSIILIASIWFLPKYIGVESLSLGLGMGMTTASALNLRMISKTLNNKNMLLRPLLLMAAFIIPSSLIASFTYGLFVYLFPNFLSIMLSAGLGAVMFILLCLVFDLVNLKAIYIALKKPKNKKLKFA